MRGTVRRVLAALMAFTMLMGQVQLAAANLVDGSDSSQEPPVQCASNQEEGDAPVSCKEHDETSVSHDAEETGVDSGAVPESEQQQSEQQQSEQQQSTEQSNESASDEGKAPESGTDEDHSSAPSDVSGEGENVEQTITAEFADENALAQDCTITLSGELPEGARVLATEAEQQAEQAGLENILCAYDITIDDGWQPEQAVEVSIVNQEIPERVRVYHIGDGQEPEEVELTRSVNGEVVFDAEGFSIYVVTEDVYRRTYEFRDTSLNGTSIDYPFTMTLPEDPDDPNHTQIKTNRQILRNGDTLVVPSMPNKEGFRFLGWYTSPTEDVNQMTPERGGVKNDINANSIVTLYARYGSYLTLTFYARPKGTQDNQVFSTQTVIRPASNESVTLDLSRQLHPEATEAGLGFAGWKLADDNTLVNLNSFTVRESVTLYPVFSRQWKVTFAPADEEEAYVAPVWVSADGFTGNLSDPDHVPTRSGYIFGGWQAGDVTITNQYGAILNENLTFAGGTITKSDESTAGTLRLTGNLTLHALWTVKQVSYRIVFWQERSSDTKKLVKTEDGWAVPEAQRDYDYVGTIYGSAPVGTVIPASEFEDYQNLGGNSSVMLQEGERDFTGMCFSALKDYYGNPLESLTVTGDGNATVHLYYDREVVTLRFSYPEDVNQAMTVEQPDYYPALPASGTVTQTAVTALSSVNYPEDVTLYGLYGGQITEGKSEDGGSAQWPVSYEASGLVYTLTTRTMQFSGGQWNLKSASSKTVTEASRSFPTYWKDADGVPVDNLGIFGHGSDLTPTHTLSNLRQWNENSTVSYFRENEQAAYPASAVYPASAAYSFTVVNGETLVVENPFTGFELDYFTYTDSRGTPIRREGNATLEQRTLTGGSFSSLKVYCKRSIHHVIFHNDDNIIASLGVKYDMSLATDYIRQYTVAPELPAGKDADEWEFAGWYVDPGCSIYLDFAGLKATDRAKLMQQYDNIHEFASVYGYRVPGGQVLPAMLMTNGDLHLFAGWVERRVLVELEPEGGELPESLPTFFWTQLGTKLNLPPISRDYVPGEQGTGAYIYHIHTYEQSQKDNDITDRSARYVPCSEEDSGDHYSHLPDSYRFLGWFQVEQRANGSEELIPFDPDTPLTGSVKLRAQWSRQGVYQLVYDKGAHGELSNTVSSTFCRDHATIALNGDVTPEPGYVFTGWRILRPDGSGELLDQLYSSGDELVVNADWAVITQNEYAENRGVITLVAQYEPVKGTSITYFVNGGTYVGPYKVSDEVKQQLLEKLRREYGATATHHYIKDENNTIIGYTVSGIEQNASLTTEDGTWFQRSGYKLMGWSSTPDGPVELELHAGGFNAASDPEGKGFVLYAVWKAEEQVTYDLQGGYWNSSNGQEYHRLESGNWVCSTGYGEIAPVPHAPTKAGYAFAGWARSSTASNGLQTMPRVTGNITLYAIWTQKAVLRFDLGGGSWTSLQKGFVALDRSCYGVLVNPGSSYTLPSYVPVRGGDYLFHKWEHGSYQYSASTSFKTTAEQAGQTLTLTAKWSQGIPVEEVLVGSDDSITFEQSDSVVGTTEDGSISMSHREISGYQYLYVLYDDVPQTKDDITELYRVTSVRLLSDQTYQVTLANGQTKTHYPDSVQKLQAVYVQDRSVDVNLVRMNVFEDGENNMNLTLTPLKDEPYTQLDVGMLDISKALPKPKEYEKVGSTAYRSYTYAIGRKNSESMHTIDTMTQKNLWIRQTLNGYAFSVNGAEWKDVDRESGSGKDLAVYIDNRVETPTTISHTVYGLKSDKEKLFTYQVYVKGRWGFNIGTGAYFLHKPDDPSENLNSYTVALHDKESVLIPLHIDYLTNQKQFYKPGDLFYDMFGNDNPTTIDNRSELRIWQEVEMRRTNELPFTNGTFVTDIQMRCTSGTNHNLFNGYDTSEDHRWLKQLGISKYYTNSFSHSFIYRRTSLDVPVHVLEATSNGLVLRDSWLNNDTPLSVTADAYTVGNELAADRVTVPEGYTLQGVQHGLSQDDLAGNDKELVLRLAAESNDATLYHLYDYESSTSSTRALVPDGSEVYLIYQQTSSVEVPVEYVKKDSSGTHYTKVDLSGYGLDAPTITVTTEQSVDFRAVKSVLEVNKAIERLDALYLTGKMMLADGSDSSGAPLSDTDYERSSDGVWENGQSVSLINTGAGIQYTDTNNMVQKVANVRVWVEVKDNVPLRIVGRLVQMGGSSTTNVSSTDVYGFLPRDEQGRVVADGTQMLVGEEFTAFKSNIPYAYDPEVTYSSESLGSAEGNAIYAVAYSTDADGYRYWTYWKKDSSEPPQRLSEETLYATYTANYSPVNVRYVVENNGAYSEVVDMDEDVAPVLAGNTIRADQTEKNVAQALALQLSEIDGYSTLYRTTGTFVLGSADLKKAFYTSETSELTLTYENGGIRYRDGTTSNVLTDTSYPDLYVVLKPIATLTVSKLIDDTGGYALWDDRFAITVQLSDSSLNKTYLLDVTSDTTQVHAEPGGQQQVTFKNGTAVITLQHAQTIAIPELPRGVRITVSEEPGSRYRVRYLFRQGEQETVGNEFQLNRHTSVTVTNISHDLTNTGEEFSDGAAYALLLSGGVVYGLYLLIRRRKA